MASASNRKRRRILSLGPAALVTAAFVGPGTITTCSVAGAGFGYSLLWGLLFSVLATIILQEMAARLGIVGKSGLGEALRNQYSRPLNRLIAVILVISAIAIGNAAYETGNIMGGVLGMETLTRLSSIDIGIMEIRLWGPVTGIIAFAILITGSYRFVERFLVGLVILMSILFLTTAILIKPDVSAILRGVFVPGIPEGGILPLVGLIGTTVVPYNLFLHASAAKRKWKDPSQLREARQDTTVSLGLGGIISMSIVITSAAAFFGTHTTISGGQDMAEQLAPLLGNWSEWVLGSGLFAAGISSAVTAPMAAAYATSGILGWSTDLKDPKSRMVWITILLAGTILSATGVKPVQAILFAQVANGILLPVIAFFLLKAVNNKKTMGEYRNNTLRNILGFIVVSITLVLGLRSILSVLGIF